jgi:hypothetical protein
MHSRRTGLLALSALALSLTLAACGDDGETTTVTETTGTGTEATETSESTETTATTSGGPSGQLTSSGVGEVKRGTTTDQAQELFGEPAKTQKGPGCELAPDSQGALAWTYQLGDGRLILVFDAASGELGSYRNTGSSMETTLGDKVGDPFSSLQANWGNSLDPLDLGVGSTAKAGIWLVKDGPENELLFDIRGGRINSISGGHIEICE